MIPNDLNNNGLFYGHKRLESEQNSYYNKVTLDAQLTHMIKTED